MPGLNEYKNLRDGDSLLNFGGYPKMDFLPYPNGITALAQHHGIPTHCLDWTKSPLIAAFFAGRGVEKTESTGRIAVWAIRPDLLRDHALGEKYNVPGFSRYMPVDFPYDQNTFLRAQQGVFLYPQYGCSHFAKYGRWPMLESFALSVAEEVKEPTIRKLTLPNPEVGELLRLLWLQGISKAHLMPTYDNVTQALVARWRWLR